MSKNKKSFLKNGKKDKNLLKIQQKIISYLLKNPSKSYNYKQIASSLDITSTDEKNLTILALKNLYKQEKVKEIEKGKYIINISLEEKEGKIEITQNENAYVIVDGEEEDIFIGKTKKKNALYGDTVSVRIFPSAKKIEGEVVNVIKRNKTSFTGIFSKSEDNNYAFVIPDSRRVHVDFFVTQKDFNKAEDGDKVIVELVEWEENVNNPRGKITQVLGKPGEHKTEIHAILAEYNINPNFPENVLAEVKEIPLKISKKEIDARRDMRNIKTFTIDPKDAKDFDDALSIQKLEKNLWEVGVHIADVTQYVKPGTELDKNAYERATSVYLVDRVVPMLPELISNEVCSLRPNEDKLTFSAVFTLNENAEIVKQWFGRTVIHSDKRYAYEEAQHIIENNDSKAELGEEILILDTLAKKLKKVRLADGAITFDRMEVKFELDEDNNPSKVYYKQSKDANHLIEEFMLLANKKVSEFVSLNKDKSENKNTFVYRIHDEPDMEKLINLKQFIKQFGYFLDLRSKETVSKSINQLLKDVKGKPEENMIETLSMRTMSKAVYATKNIGHYGLAFEHYSHFTSPIRRYPDMITHRLLQHYLDGGKSPNSDSYEKNCKHCNDQERMASDAERDSIKYMQVKIMQDNIGAEFDGVISGVTEWGIYVEIPSNLSEGMVKLKDMKQDHFVFDQKTYSVVGRKTKERYQLGDKVRIKVLAADLQRKQLDFSLLEKVLN